MRKHVEESVATGAAAGRGRGGRFSAGRKREVVMRLLRGEDLESVSRAVGITAARASHGRAQFLAAGQAGLKSRATEYRDELLAMMPAGFVAVSGLDSVPADVARTTAAGVQVDDDRVEPLRNRWRPARRRARPWGSVLGRAQGNTGESAELAARELFKTTAAANVRNRAEDTVEACDEVIRRFGKSEIPAVLAGC